MSDNAIVLFGIIATLAIIVGLFTTTYINEEKQHKEVMHCLEMKYPIEQCILLNNIR